MVQAGKQLEIFDLLNINITAFTGPLDLLLELIRKQKMDIGDISLAEICTPYLEHLELMKEFNMDIAIEFLDIASTLILIKSQALLPKPEKTEEEESLDIEEKLRAKLIEYRRYKLISEYFDRREVLGRDTFSRPDLPDEDVCDETAIQFSDLSIYGLLMAYSQSIRKKEYRKPHTISKEAYPIERKILEFMNTFKSGQVLLFQQLFVRNPSRSDIVISFIAILELAKLAMMKLHQMTAFAPIHCKSADNFEEMVPILANQFKNVS